MKMSSSTHRLGKGFTLLEMTIVIMLLLGLIKLSLFTSNSLGEWRLGRAASESLRSVYSAQRMYLADNPTASVANLTNEILMPYLPNRMAAMPTVKSLTGAMLSIRVSVSPPVVNAGSGLTYDPSGRSSDSLWDVGQ